MVIHSLNFTVIVVNIKSKAEAFRVYVGRSGIKADAGMPALANPFRIGVDGDRNTVIEKYRAWLWRSIQRPDSPQLEALVELLSIARDQQIVELACHCAPRRCHAEVIAACLKWLDEVVDLADAEVDAKIGRLSHE
jgi:hypothetical protein